MSFSNKTNICISSLKDLLRCISLASLLEISGWPKPGNVHRTKDFENTRYEHFLASISAIQPCFHEFCFNIFKNYADRDQDFQFVGLGDFYIKATKVMMKWQNGGNVLLGHILLLSPLAAAATISLKQNQLTLKNLEDNLEKIIRDATVEDTINLYKAIRICSPGGLGKIEKYDITDQNSVKELKEDNISLRKIFKLSESYDSISYEYANGFQIILELGLPYYLEKYDQTHDINIATVDTFLKLLSEVPDTLISRKLSEKEALDVSKKAEMILKKGGISTREGLKLTKKLDLYMHSHKGKMNPGTTADLLSAVIFMALLLGIRF